jgi:GNAT superfamily N-acetyltransferase
MIRDLRPDDAAAVATLHAIVDPAWAPPTEAGLRHWLETHPERGRFRAWVAEQNDVAGFAFAHFHWTAATPGIGWMWAGVHPDARGRGLGRALFAAAEEHLLEHGARKLETFALEDSAGERFAEARGFRRTRRELVQRLDPHDVDRAAAERLERGKAEEGFRVVPLAAASDRLQELHAVYAAAAADVPADDPEVDLRLAEWERHDLGDPELSWEGSAVVLAEDRPVALAFLLVNPDAAVAGNAMTGTLPDFRGRGLARLAKLATVRWAAENGIREVVTENDAENAPMLALNRSLGYRLTHVRAQLAREPAAPKPRAR